MTAKKTTTPKKESDGNKTSEKESAEKKTSSAKKQIDEVFMSRAMKTKAQLDALPKVRILVPSKPGEPDGITLDVTINGYKYSIPKNVMVDVPQTVAEIIAESEKLTLDAGKNMKVGRSKEVDDALL